MTGSAIASTRPWNGGRPVWNKGKAMKPPLRCLCARCGAEFFVTRGSRAALNVIYRIRRGGPAYCSGECRRTATASKISATLMGHLGHTHDAPETSAVHDSRMVDGRRRAEA